MYQGWSIRLCMGGGIGGFSLGIGCIGYFNCWRGTCFGLMGGGCAGITGIFGFRGCLSFWRLLLSVSGFLSFLSILL